MKLQREALSPKMSDNHATKKEVYVPLNLQNVALLRRNMNFKRDLWIILP